MTLKYVESGWSSSSLTWSSVSRRWKSFSNKQKADDGCFWSDLLVEAPRCVNGSTYDTFSYIRSTILSKVLNTYKHLKYSDCVIFAWSAASRLKIVGFTPPI